MPRTGVTGLSSTEDGKEGGEGEHTEGLGAMVVVVLATVVTTRGEELEATVVTLGLLLRTALLPVGEAETIRAVLT